MGWKLQVIDNSMQISTMLWYNKRQYERKKKTKTKKELETCTTMQVFANSNSLLLSLFSSYYRLNLF